MGRDVKAGDLVKVVFVLAVLLVVAAVLLRLLDFALGPFSPVLAALVVALVIAYFLKER